LPPLLGTHALGGRFLTLSTEQRDLLVRDAAAIVVSLSFEFNGNFAACL
jgi:hypothetical protein